MSRTDVDKSPGRNLENNVKSQNFIQEPLSDDLKNSADLNTFLLHRIRDLKSENSNLRQLINEANGEVQRMKESRVMEMANSSEGMSEGSTTKIMQLRDMCDHQATELVIVKTKCMELENELASKKIELENKSLNWRKQNNEKSIEFKDSGTMTQQETKMIQDQLMETARSLERANEVEAKKIIELKGMCNHQATELVIVKTKCMELDNELASKKVELENKSLNCRKQNNEKSIEFKDSGTMTQQETKMIQDQLMETARSLERANEVEAKKIIELKGMCNHQATELVIVKAKCMELKSELARNKIELQKKRMIDKKQNNEKSIELKTSETMTEEETKIVEDQPLEKDDRLRILTEKLERTNAKLYEAKNTCMSLRQEINKAQKLLCKEVGDNVTIASLSNPSSGWRGRAEQLQNLQQKIADMQMRFNNKHDGSSSTICSSCSTSAVLSEQRKIVYLKNLETERRRQMEISSRDLRQAEDAREACQKKLQAARARIKVIENELNNLKINLALLNEKRIHDDQLIEELNGQLKTVSEKYRQREHDVRRQKEKTESTCRDLREELNAVRMQVDVFRKKLVQKESEIENFRNGTTNNGCERTWTARNPNVQTLGTQQSSRDPDEQGIMMTIAAESDNQRLLELVTLLNKRLIDERTMTDRNSDLLRQEKTKNSELLTRLRRMELERVKMTKMNNGYASKYPRSSANSESIENFNPEKIKFKLELLEEECMTLKVRLTTIQQEKTTDLVIYKKMLEHMQKTFQDAIREKLNYKGGFQSNGTS